MKLGSLWLKISIEASLFKIGVVGDIVSSEGLRRVAFKAISFAPAARSSLPSASLS